MTIRTVFSCSTPFLNIQSWFQNFLCESTIEVISFFLEGLHPSLSLPICLMPIKPTLNCPSNTKGLGTSTPRTSPETSSSTLDLSLSSCTTFVCCLKTFLCPLCPLCDSGTLALSSYIQSITLGPLISFLLRGSLGWFRNNGVWGTSERTLTALWIFLHGGGLGE